MRNFTRDPDVVFLFGIRWNPLKTSARDIREMTLHEQLETEGLGKGVGECSRSSQQSQDCWDGLPQFASRQ